MKRFMISELMDEYMDNEVFPQGGEGVDTGAVKARVLAKAAPAGKKGRPRRKKVLLGAVLAAVMVVLVGAGFPFISYRLAGGGDLFYQETSDGNITALRHTEPLMTLEDGRLWFILDGQSMDITDLISEETPYIHDASDPDTGMTYYIIMGGTPEAYGWFEWIVPPDSFGGADAAARPRGMYDCKFVFHGGQPDETSAVYGDLYADGVDWSRVESRPWLVAAVEALGIPAADVSDETNDSYMLQ